MIPPLPLFLWNRYQTYFWCLAVVQRQLASAAANETGSAQTSKGKGHKALRIEAQKSLSLLTLTLVGVPIGSGSYYV